MIYIYIYKYALGLTVVNKSLGTGYATKID